MVERRECEQSMEGSRGVVTGKASRICSGPTTKGQAESSDLCGEIHHQRGARPIEEAEKRSATAAGVVDQTTTIKKPAAVQYSTAFIRHEMWSN